MAIVITVSVPDSMQEYVHQAQDEKVCSEIWQEALMRRYSGIELDKKIKKLNSKVEKLNGLKKKEEEKQEIQKIEKQAEIEEYWDRKGGLRFQIKLAHGLRNAMEKPYFADYAAHFGLTKEEFHDWCEAKLMEELK